MNLNEITNEVENFKEKAGYWETLEDCPIEDWRYEVANDDTREGYHDWCINRLANAEDDDEAA